MKNIIDFYEINGSTMALLAVAHIDYSTLVLEEGRQFFVRQTPSQIIKAGCLEGGSTFDGRRKAVSYQTGAKQKVPIPINPKDNIFAFPTHSPKSFECSWIFYHHVKYITIFTSPSKQTFQSKLTFKNGKTITLSESLYILEKQMQRTALCILKFSKNPI